MEFIFSHNSKRLSYVSPWCSTTTSNMSRLEHVTMKGEASHCLLSHSLGNTLQIERVKYMYMYTYYISSSVQWKCTAHAIVTERSVPPIQFLPIIGQRICWHNCNDNLQLVNKCTNLNIHSVSHIPSLRMLRQLVDVNFAVSRLTRNFQWPAQKGKCLISASW